MPNPGQAAALANLGADDLVERHLAWAAEHVAKIEAGYSAVYFNADDERGRLVVIALLFKEPIDPTEISFRDADAPDRTVIVKDSILILVAADRSRAGTQREDLSCFEAIRRYLEGLSF